MSDLKRGRTRTRQRVEITRTLDRGLRVLETIAEAAPVSLSDIARHVDLTPATTFRLLETLRQRDYVLQHEQTGLYELGPKAFQVGAAFTQRLRLHQVAQPVLARLAEELGDPVTLAIRDGADVIYIDQREGRGIMQMASRIGDRLPIHCTAAGKAMAAWLWEGALRDIVGDDPFRKRTDATITTWPDLMAELDGVRKAGYALDREECEAEICCIAAPLRSRDGQVAGAISVSRMSSRFPQDDPSDLAAAIVSAADDISRRLGWTGGDRAPVHQVEDEDAADMFDD